MGRAIATILVLVVAGGLMIFSASGTLMFLTPLFTKQPDLPYFALLAFDGGVIAWLITFITGARGIWQRAISFLMVLVDLIGVVVGFGTNMLMNAGTVGMVKLDEQTVQTALTAIVGVIALNIAAAVAFHIFAPEIRRRMAQEEAKDKIEDEALKRLKEQAPQLAAEVVPLIAATWIDGMRAEFTALIGDEAIKLLDAPGATATTKRAEKPTLLDRLREMAVSRAETPAKSATMADDSPGVVHIPVQMEAAAPAPKSNGKKGKAG